MSNVSNSIFAVGGNIPVSNNVFFGCGNGWYPTVTKVTPRVYHKYLKQTTAAKDDEQGSNGDI